MNFIKNECKNSWYSINNQKFEIYLILIDSLFFYFNPVKLLLMFVLDNCDVLAFFGLLCPTVVYSGTM